MNFAPARIIQHGMILRSPSTPPEGTTGSTAYELGCCLQLDREHCLLLASLDEQGGGDLVAGNDAFVFTALDEIQPAKAIIVNRGVPDFTMADGRKAYLAKFPAFGAFVPLGAKLADGSDHPSAGTGLLVSCCVTFAPDKKSALLNPDSFIETIQVSWDGESVRFYDHRYHTEFLGLPLSGDRCLGTFCPIDRGFLLPFGIVGRGICVMRFDGDESGWHATSRGEPFYTNPASSEPSRAGDPWKYVPGESEASLKRAGAKYYLFTRGTDPMGRLYESADGFAFALKLERPNVTVPQVLNQGLDGSLYLATNPGPGWLRNPLVAYNILGEGAASEGFMLHDQDGARDDTGESIPFVDHAVGANVFLDGRPRHFLFYRVCDLKERTLHQFQIEEGDHLALYGESGPSDRKSTTGLYLMELEFEASPDFETIVSQQL